jgi:hypothetical protein
LRVLVICLVVALLATALLAVRFATLLEVEADAGYARPKPPHSAAAAEATEKVATPASLRTNHGEYSEEAADDDGEGSLGSGIVQSERASVVGGVLPTSHLNLDGGSGGGSRGEGDDGTGAAAATGATTGAAAVAAAGTAAVTASAGAAAAGAATAVPPLEGGAGVEIIAVEEEKEEEVAAVLQDVNFMEFLRGFPLVLSKEGKLALIDAVRRDTNFLARGRIMDYSLLIGFDAERNELVVGIIDYLRRSVCA